jgi:hypothetical protein
MEILNGIAFNPQPTASKLLFCTLVVLSRTQSAAVQTAIEYEYRFTEYRFAEYEYDEIQ